MSVPGLIRISILACARAEYMAEAVCASESDESCHS
jgi:hypothetical protein